jgi:hypothetical protein
MNRRAKERVKYKENGLISLAGEDAVTTKNLLLIFLILFLSACAGSVKYRDPNMDFGSVQKVAVLPFANLTREEKAADRVRDVYMNMLMATGGLYLLPTGEVARGISRAQLTDRTAPSEEEIKRLGGVLGVDTVITGVLKEYGEVRSGSVSSNLVSLSLQMFEVKTGKIVWSASSTKGGVSTMDRLFGGGGKPMNVVTEEAVIDLINKLYK